MVVYIIILIVSLLVFLASIGINVVTVIDPNIFKITKYNIREYNDNKRKIELQYSDFEKVNGKYIPTKIKINIHGDTYLKVNIEYSNIIVNDYIDFFFNVPNKYDRIYR